jgi:hypothetical protein
LEAEMAKLWNLSVMATAALLAVSCGSDNDTGGSGNGIGINGAPATSSNCSPSKSMPSSRGNWDQFKQHIYNCNFDPVAGNQGGNYGGYSMIIPTKTFVYSRVNCEYGCYESGGYRELSVDFNQDGGSVRSIVDFRSSVSSERQAHDRIKNLVIGSVSNVQQSNNSNMAYTFVKGGRRYMIDLSWPMIANPVMDIPANDESSDQNGYWISGEY